jgi:hypothetical protein
MSQRFPESVQKLLLKAGWFPGRDVELPALPTDYVLFDKAEKALREFGALKVGETGAGVDLAKSDTLFLPAMAEGMSPGTGVFSKAGKRIYPLGELYGGAALLFIDEEGGVHYWHDEVEPVAPSLDQALVKLLLGIR